MRRLTVVCACALLWVLGVCAVAGYVRSRVAGDVVTWRTFRSAEPGVLRVREVRLHSASGGLQFELRRGVVADIGAPDNLEAYGPTGFTHDLVPADGYPEIRSTSWFKSARGFAMYADEFPAGWPGSMGVAWYGFTLPYWFVVTILFTPALLIVLRAVRRARLVGAKVCVACGYDLRATPGRCPECGTVPAKSGRGRLPRALRISIGAMLVTPGIVLLTLRLSGLFEPPPPHNVHGGVALNLPTVSPTVWAPRKLSPPAGFASFTESIAGSTVNFKMVPIPGGKFRMGSPASEAGRREDEGPQVDVIVEPFYMSQFEVTQAEYDEFRNHYLMVASAFGGHAPPPQADAVTYPTPLYELEAGPVLQRMGRGPGFPAVGMSQYVARQYTKWLSRKTGRHYRLPTEAEWEYACRAGTSTAFHFGDDASQLGKYAWTFDNSAGRGGEPSYHAVGLKLPNPWGLFDMYGNVAEWVADGYSADRYQTLAPGPVSASAVAAWPTKRYPCVLRGGGYESEVVDCRSAARTASTRALNAKDPDLPRSVFWESDGFWVGFRVVSPVRDLTAAERQRFWDDVDPQTSRDLSKRKDHQVRELIPPYR